MAINLVRYLLTLMIMVTANSTYAEESSTFTTYGYGLTSYNRDLPRNLMSMEAVRTRYGEPEAVLSAVGNPPITRWDYDTCTVYFEHNLVITSVPQLESIEAAN